MSATQFPTEVINQIDKRRRSFLWAGNKEYSAAKSLVAWPNVCTTKDLGGLGIKVLETHNICLLLNLIHCLHCANSSAWANWLRERVDMENMIEENLGTHWDLLRSLIPLYQALTTVSLGDGKSTSFWTDVWVGDEALEDRFPYLFSHCTKVTYSVEQAISSQLQGCFVNRLSIRHSNNSSSSLLSPNRYNSRTSLIQEYQPSAGRRTSWTHQPFTACSKQEDSKRTPQQSSSGKTQLLREYSSSSGYSSKAESNVGPTFIEKRLCNPPIALCLMLIKRPRNT